MKELLQELSKIVKRNQPEPVSLSNALGRVIANDVLSLSSIPARDTCNVDGYAVHSSSINQIPTPLKKIGRSKPIKIFQGEVGLGEVVEVAANVPLPDGADAVIPKSKIESDDGVMILVNDYVNEGQNVSIAGIDVSKNDVVFREGTIINSRHIALASVLNIPWLPVVRAPRIGILTSTADNIQTYDDRSKNLSACVAEAVSYFLGSHGAVPVLLGHGAELYDSPEEIILFKSNLENALKSVDLLLVIGGVENSQDNLIYTTLAQKGTSMQKAFVSIGSGHHAIIGNKEEIPVIGLTSHYVAFILLARLCLIPIIHKMIGIHKENKIYAKLTRDLDEHDERTDYLYGILNRKKTGELAVSPVSAQDSLMLSVLTRTECMIIVEKTKGLKAGDSVEIIMLDGSLLNA